MTHPQLRDSLPMFERIRSDKPCVACLDTTYAPGELHLTTDYDTGLCRPCWRVVVLGPAMANLTKPGFP